MATRPMRVLAVVVLFRKAAEVSKTLVGLARAFKDEPSLLEQFDVLVWDNSPQAAGDLQLPFACTYHHAAINEGVSGAYNGAAKIAADRGCAWLLLLDDDTSVTADFLRGIVAGAEPVAGEEHVAAVTPFLYAGSFSMSPRLWRFARHVPLPRPAQPYTETRAIFAANSGTLMRVSALAAVGGYSARFWLDFSDIEVFDRLHARGFAVRIASDLALEHEMAMLDYDRRMTPERFAIFLRAESDFLDLRRGPLERGMHLLRLCARVLHQRSYADPTYSRLSCGALWERLTTRRATRLERHERDAGAHRG